MNKLSLSILENKNLESLILGDNFEADKEFGQSQDFYDEDWKHENQLEKLDVSDFKKTKRGQNDTKRTYQSHFLAINSLCKTRRKSTNRIFHLSYFV